MPDRKALKVGDRVRFVALPDEWRRPGFTVGRGDRDFMRAMIRRSFSSRIYEIDEYGTPWIAARIWHRERWEYHWWGLFESTGWRKVERRSRRKAAGKRRS